MQRRTGSKTLDLLPYCNESMSSFQTIEVGKNALLHESFRTLAAESGTALASGAYFQLLEVQYIDKVVPHDDRTRNRPLK